MLLLTEGVICNVASLILKPNIYFSSSLNWALIKTVELMGTNFARIGYQYFMSGQAYLCKGIRHCCVADLCQIQSFQKKKTRPSAVFFYCFTSLSSLISSAIFIILKNGRIFWNTLYIYSVCMKEKHGSSTSFAWKFFGYYWMTYIEKKGGCANFLTFLGLSVVLLSTISIFYL